ncbi:hypothetical protein [Neobacillus drentensis]|uniref:hypothetical protein n=1 Tax=Neobacillus drentensis TaxID=220684 RepID=UPI002FFDEB8D
MFSKSAETAQPNELNEVLGGILLQVGGITARVGGILPRIGGNNFQPLILYMPHLILNYNETER